MPVPFGSAWQPRLLLKHGARPLLAALQTHCTRLTAHQPSCLHSLLHTSFSPCIVSIFRGVTMSSDLDSVGSGPQGVDGRGRATPLCVGSLPRGCELDHCQSSQGGPWRPGRWAFGRGKGTLSFLGPPCLGLGSEASRRQERPPSGWQGRMACAGPGCAGTTGGGLESSDQRAAVFKEPRGFIALPFLHYNTLCG